MGKNTLEISYQTPGMVGVKETVLKLSYALKDAGLSVSLPSDKGVAAGVIHVEKPKDFSRELVSLRIYGLPLANSPFPDGRNVIGTEFSRWVDPVNDDERMKMNEAIRNRAIDAGAEAADVPDIIPYDNQGQYMYLPHENLAQANKNVIDYILSRLAVKA